MVELPAFNRKDVGSSPTGITKLILSLSGYSNWLLTSRDNVLNRGFESHQDHKRLRFRRGRTVQTLNLMTQVHRGFESHRGHK